MSFRKKGRKLRPESGKHLSNIAVKLSVAEDFDFTQAIAAVLQETFGGSASAVKTVMAFTGAGERAVRNWFEGINGPNGNNLVRLVQHSDEVLEIFLLMARREEILKAKLLVDARDTLITMLELIEQLTSTDEVEK